MAERIYGIDFGTYAVKIYKIRQGICFHQKSVIATKEKGQVIAIGEEAAEMIGKQPEYIRIEQPIKNGVVASYDSMLSLMNCIALEAEKRGQAAKAMVSAVGALPLFCPPQEARRNAAAANIQKNNFEFILFRYDVIT